MYKGRFKKKRKTKKRWINPSGLAAWVQNPTKKIIAETASNNLTNDLEQKKIYPKKGIIIDVLKDFFERFTVDYRQLCLPHSQAEIYPAPRLQYS